MTRGATTHNEVTCSSNTLAQPSKHALISLTCNKEALQVLRELSLECVNPLGYDPLVPNEATLHLLLERDLSGLVIL